MSLFALANEKQLCVIRATKLSVVVISITEYKNWTQWVCEKVS